MSGTHLLDRAHRAMHRLPGIPAHPEHPRSRHGHRRSPHLGSRHPRFINPTRPPRVLVAWQGWIARRLGRTPR